MDPQVSDVDANNTNPFLCAFTAYAFLSQYTNISVKGSVLYVVSRVHVLCLNVTQLQLHASIISVILEVEWQWRPTVEDVMGPSEAPAGSMMDFDAGCAFGSCAHPHLLSCKGFITLKYQPHCCHSTHRCLHH